MCALSLGAALPLTVSPANADVINSTTVTIWDGATDRRRKWDGRENQRKRAPE